MVRHNQDAVLGHVRVLFEVGAVGSMSDGDLLERFVHDRERTGDAAFEVLVQRHGPMVFRVCRQTLGEIQDVEDAFQATFLILARNARSIRDRESLGAWLFGVARKVSSRSRNLTIQRRQREIARAGKLEVSETKPDESEILLKEVERLPKPLREPVVLCYWQGLTYAESAAILGVTEATIRGRLARARDLLRSRLAREGVSAETIASGLAIHRGLEALPLRLILPTVQASSLLGAGQSLVGLVTPSVISLWQGVSKSMWTAKWIPGVVLVTAIVGTIGLGSAVLAVQKTARPATARSAFSRKAEQPGQGGARPADEKLGELAKLVEGQIVRSAEVTKDCMILSYMPDWGFGNVDNIALEGVNGGVRTLVDWPDVPASEAKPEALQFYLAFYSKTTKSSAKPGSILALEISDDWPERTSWKTKPYTEPDPIGTYKVEPGDGWKIFNITSFVRKNEGRSGPGLMFRFLNEDRPASKETAGYQFVSREGAEQWADKRPRLLVVDRTKK